MDYVSKMLWNLLHTVLENCALLILLVERIETIVAGFDKILCSAKCIEAFFPDSADHLHIEKPN